jgi:hypothetical protein
MRVMIGIILMLAGGGLIVYGLLGALQELRGLYEGATGDAIGMAPTAEQDASRGMIRAAIIGGCGVPLFIAGSVVLKVTVLQKLMGKKESSRTGR